MTTMAQTDVVVTGGVQVHLDVHVAAALDGIGGQLGVKSLSTTLAGYRRLLAWLASFGTVVRVGVEATGSYSAGLGWLSTWPPRALTWSSRPTQPFKTGDGAAPPTPVDAVSAARAALSGNACGQAKARNGAVEAIRVLRVARACARHDRNEALNQMRSLLSTAADELREQLRDLSITQLVATAAALRPGSEINVASATKTAVAGAGPPGPVLGRADRTTRRPTHPAGR
jgi:transposase